MPFSNDANPMRIDRLPSNNAPYMKSKCKEHVNLYACYLASLHSIVGGGFKVFHICSKEFMLKTIKEKKENNQEV
jgi:hypothetical protein